MAELTHLDEQGHARMVDVGGKAESSRSAVAKGTIAMSAAALAAIRDGAVPKGDVLATARIAGIMAAKKTADLIPLCHPLALTRVTLDFAFVEGGVEANAQVSLTGRTGVEMEAMTACCIALLTIYDMAKALDKSMTVGPVRLVEKRGGKSGDWFADPSRMTRPLALEVAQARLLALAPELSVERRAIEACAGFYSVEPLVALRTQPAAAMSAMDGYAVRANDPGPWRVIGESAAGRPCPIALGANEAARISTGALLPEGADTILIQEDCRLEGDRLEHDGPSPPPGTHVRRAGLDFTASAELIPSGARIGPAQLALAIAAGHRQLAVRRRVRLAVTDCGDELCPSGMAVEPHQLPASNGPMLAAMVGALPCDVTRIGPLPDRLEALLEAFDAARDADVIVISGGASVGDHDLVRPALAEAGATLDFWRVAIKPGKPLLVARRGHQVIVGLPGNPASAYVTAFLFVLPLLRAALGAADPLPRAIPARLGASLAAGGKRLEFLRARCGAGCVTPEAAQDSGGLLSLARANALIRREIGAPPAAAGDTVEVHLLDNGGVA